MSSSSEKKSTRPKSSDKSKKTVTSKKKGVYGALLDGVGNRISGTEKGVASTMKHLLDRVQNATNGSINVAKGVLTLNPKKVGDGAVKVGKSTVGVFTNTAHGAVDTSRALITGKYKNSVNKINKKTK